ncbi:MAG: molybdopterin molybdotransferase MoeA, partial [Planctomycetota bacterium]
MLSFEHALKTVLSSARQLAGESVELTHAANRILARDVISDIDIPPFNKAAMDGYACRRQDLANELTVIETIPAGRQPEETVGPNQCAKIMTGSAVPKGADCVIMKEHVQITGQKTVLFQAENTADHFCRKGEDVRAGDIVLRRGTLIKPQHIAVLASVGHLQVSAAARPQVAVIATGDELVDPASKPGPSQIRNSNSFQLAAQVENMGALAENYGTVKDST